MFFYSEFEGKAQNTYTVSRCCKIKLAQFERYCNNVNIAAPSSLFLSLTSFLRFRLPSSHHPTIK